MYIPTFSGNKIINNTQHNVGRIINDLQTANVLMKNCIDTAAL